MYLSNQAVLEASAEFQLRKIHTWRRFLRFWDTWDSAFLIEHIEVLFLCALYSYQCPTCPNPRTVQNFLSLEKHRGVALPACVHSLRGTESNVAASSVHNYVFGEAFLMTSIGPKRTPSIFTAGGGRSFSAVDRDGSFAERLCGNSVALGASGYFRPF